MLEFADDRQRKRDRTPHEFPVLERNEVGPLSPQQEALLLALYAQVCQNWRTLLDVRFKLLALIPTVSFVLIGTLLSSNNWSQFVAPWMRVALAGLGILATGGLWLYEKRNSELYTDLGSRARRIEYELGIHTGAFLGRLTRQNRFIDHTFAISLVYGSALVAWLAAAIAVLRS